MTDIEGALDEGDGCVVRLRVQVVRVPLRAHRAVLSAGGW